MLRVRAIDDQLFFFKILLFVTTLSSIEFLLLSQNIGFGKRVKLITYMNVKQ